MVLLRQMVDKMNFSKVLQESPLPVQGSNRGFSPEQLILNFIVGVWCGANCFEHLEVIRQDKVIREIFDWETMPGHRAFKRYFSKFNQITNQDVFKHLYRWFFSNLQFNNLTLDFDSTIITRYGNQQGAEKGYNPKKPGRKSHHPLIAFVHETRMVSNFWLRPGNSYTTNNFLSFLEDTLDNLADKKAGLIRADSGFYCNEILDYMESGSPNP